MEGKLVQITGARRSGTGPGAGLCCVCFSLSRWYDYLSIVQISAFRPSLSHSASESQSFRFSVNIFSRSAVAWGRGGGFEFFFSFTVARIRCQWLWFRRDEGGAFVACCVVL
jgi:hypothetical protein